jgi:hypothetical protein
MQETVSIRWVIQHIWQEKMNRQARSMLWASGVRNQQRVERASCKKSEQYSFDFCDRDHKYAKTM